jgi:hypothetical protein
LFLSPLFFSPFLSSLLFSHLGRLGGHRETLVELLHQRRRLQQLVLVLEAGDVLPGVRRNATQRFTVLVR